MRTWDVTKTPALGRKGRKENACHGISYDDGKSPLRRIILGSIAAIRKKYIEFTVMSSMSFHDHVALISQTYSVSSTVLLKVALRFLWFAGRELSETKRA
jgi:hypothetical protein